MRRIGSGSRAIRCSRPIRVRRTNPARSSTFTCFETALSDMSKGSARSVTRVAEPAAKLIDGYPYVGPAEDLKLK